MKTETTTCFPGGHTTDKLVNIITATLSQDIKFWYVRLENRLLFQFSSHPDIIPLPL
ncbi:MAG TPA: putative porin, partial [Bacteroidales bacterium]|nr:putative porin [Bacteroidales bacterium]